MMSLMPLARTPWGDEGARHMTNYSRSIQRQIDALAPWVEQTERQTLRNKVKSGTIVVIPDESDMPNDPLYAEATIVKG